MKPLYTTLLLLTALYTSFGADLMPDAANRTNAAWWVAGVIGGIPTVTTEYSDVVEEGANNANGANAAAIIEAEFNAATSNTFVNMPAGIYRISTGMDLTKSGVVLRGAGMDVTYLIVTNSTEINLGPGDSDSGTLLTISSGGTKGSTSATLNAVTGIAVGEQCRFLYAGTNAMPWGQFWSESGGHYTADSGYLGQDVYVQSISGTTINFSPPLTWDCTHSSSRVRPMSTPTVMAGIEDMTIITDKNHGGQGTLNIQNGVNCWVKNVKFVNVPTRGIVINKSCHIEVRKCYMSNDRVPASNGGDCITFFYSNSGCLIVDSIFYKGEPGVKFGDGLSFSTLGNSGNVVAYNYIAVGNDDGGDYWLGLSMNHGFHNWNNLFEGNVHNVYMQDDGYHGSSSHNVIFRSRFVGHSGNTGLGNLGCISLCRFSYTNAIIGCVLGDNALTFDYMPTNSEYAGKFIYKLGYPEMGNNSHTGIWTGGVPMSTSPATRLDKNVIDSTFLHANYDTVNDGIVVVSGYESNSMPASYFLPNKPSWFFNRPWPPIDPSSPSTSVATNIPAGFRYVFGTDPPAEGGTPTVTNFRVSGKISTQGKVMIP